MMKKEEEEQEQESKIKIKIKSESDELLNLHHQEFNDEEMEVSRTLLDLKQCPIHNFWPLTWFSESNLKWGAKRIRLPLTLLPAPPPPPPPPPVLVVPPEQTDCSRRRRRRNSEDEEGQVNNNIVAATSPATPLAFSPSESEDDKFINNNAHPHTENTSNKRSREELLKTLKELTERNIALKKERESLGSHYNASLAYNRMLKHLEKQVKSYFLNSSSHKPEEPQINYQIHFNNNQISLLPVLLPLQQQQQPPPMNGKSVIGTREQFQYPYFHRQISAAPPPPLVSSNGVGLAMDVDRDRFNHVVAPVESDNMGDDAIAIAIAAADSTVGSLRYQKAKCAAAARLERRLKIKIKKFRKHR